MAESAPPQPQPTSEELHRGLGHLREDIQDLRNQVGGIHHRIDETSPSPGEEIQEEIQKVHEATQAHFRWTMAALVVMTGILIGVIKF